MASIFQQIKDFFNEGTLQNAPKLDGSLAEQNAAKKNGTSTSSGYSFVKSDNSNKSSGGNASVFTRNTSSGNTASATKTSTTNPNSGFMFKRSTSSGSGGTISANAPKPAKTDIGSVFKSNRSTSTDSGGVSLINPNSGKLRVTEALDSTRDGFAAKRSTDNKTDSKSKN